MDNKIYVLDKGFVCFLDKMGSDASIAEDARTSYGQGTTQVNKDTGLLRYLKRHRHTSPFEMAEMKFQIKVPIYIWRQWVRHRTANVNEVSGRYSELPCEFHKIGKYEWRLQSNKNKQGSREEFSKHGVHFSLDQDLLHDSMKDSYNFRLKGGIAREIARNELPLSTYTIVHWKMDLHNLFHFLSLRMDSHAQKEIQEYANAIAYFAKKHFPISYQAFYDYQLHSNTFSRMEMEVLKKYINNKVTVDNMCEDLSKMEGVSKREVEEFKKLWLKD